MEQSPLCLAHPPEDRLYGHLAPATSSCGEFVLFCRAAESRLAACLSVVGRRNSGTRSVLVGQTLRRLPSRLVLAVVGFVVGSVETRFKKLSQIHAHAHTYNICRQGLCVVKILHDDNSTFLS